MAIFAVSNDDTKYMAQEIERKFLVSQEGWKDITKRTYYKQGYLSSQAERTVRVRIAGKEAFLTIKGKTTGISRTEFEYAIPVAEAQEMLDNLCQKLGRTKGEKDLHRKQA